MGGCYIFLVVLIENVERDGLYFLKVFNDK